MTLTDYMTCTGYPYFQAHLRVEPQAQRGRSWKGQPRGMSVPPEGSPIPGQANCNTSPEALKDIQHTCHSWPRRKT